MTRQDLGRWMLAVVLVAPLAVPRPSAAQSTNIADYALLAADAIRATRVTVTSGDVAVTTGSLATRNGLLAPTSTVAAGTVHLDPNTTCQQLFANGGTTAPGCQNGQAFTSPFADLGAACGFPSPFPACNPGAAGVLVPHGQTVSLPAGTYGAVKVEGGAGGPGTLLLGAGPYTFCSLVVSRNGRVLFTAPGVLNVADTFTLSNASALGPQAGSGVTADQVQVFGNGPRARLSRNASLDALYCGPHSRFTASSGATLSGRLVAQTIRLKRNSYTRVTPPPTTTTSTSTTTSTTASTTSTTASTTSTTTTTVPPACDHDGVVDPGEECDDTLPCHASSATGALVDGSETGAFVICQDCRLVACEPTTTTTTTPSSTTTTAPSSTTTTAPSTTSTTTPTSTTTTTTLAATCHNGVVEPGETCDDELPCHPASTDGAFLDGSAAGGFVVCQDCQLVACEPTTTSTTPFPTTTSSTTTTTTPPTSTTSTTAIVTTTTTTVPPDCIALCGNGVVDAQCDEQCDGSAFGGFPCPGSPTRPTCSADCRTIDTSTCTEVCDDCTDNDGNGLTDLEDPACCSGTPQVAADLRKAFFRARTPQTAMRLRTKLAKGFVIRPMHDDVSVQIRQGTELLCAQLPAAKFMKRKGTKGTFKFWDRKGAVESAQGISDMTVKVQKNGLIRVRTRGKHVRMATPAGGRLNVTFGFRDPTVGDSSNRCATTAPVIRPSKSGKKLRYP
jgi:hypothetical protein